jgi:hypothetical protein
MRRRRKKAESVRRHLQNFRGKKKRLMILGSSILDAIKSNDESFIFHIISYASL